MQNNHYTIKRVSNAQFDLYYQGIHVGESPTLAGAETMQDNHDKRRERDLPCFLVPQAS